MCSRNLIIEKKDLVQSDDRTQTIIVATETLSESKCKTLGKSKAEQYTKAGWKCVGYKGELS
ncbi:MAG: hypothetical protein PHY93_17020 [Bacteriovorax sp.]|nr:hypothetical protein [Bacteriovorax sp.]